MNLFVNIGSDPIKNAGVGFESRVGMFPLVYFWLKDHFYQEYQSYFSSINWNWHDSYTDSIDTDTELQNKLLENPPKIFAQSIYVWNENQMFNTAKWVRKNFRDCLIIAAGPSAEIKESFLKKHPYYDVAINGPGAESFSEIVKNTIDKKSFYNINDIAFYDSNKRVIINNHVKHKKNPLLLNYVNNFTEETKAVIKKLKKDFDVIRFPTLLLQGCPYACSFCEQGQEIWGKINKRPVEMVLDEINLFSEYKNSVIDFIDSNFGIHKEYEEIIDHLINIHNAEHNKKIKLGYLTWAKENLNRVISLQKKLQNNKDLTCDNIEGLSLQDINKDILKLNGRPFNSEDKKIEKFNEELGNNVDYRSSRLEFMLAMPGQSFESIINSFVELNENNLVSSWPPYIYTLFPNTPLTESNDFKTTDFKGNKVFISDSGATTIGFLTPKNKRKNIQNLLTVNYLIETPTLSTIELASSLYFYTLMGHVIGFWRVLNSPFLYLKNYYGIKKSVFLKKILWKFSPTNHHNLPTNIQTDIFSLCNWLTGKTRFLDREDIYKKYYLEPNTISIYRWMSNYTDFLSLFYEAFVDIVGHNDIIFQNMLFWAAKKSLRFDKECFDNRFEVSYNYDDIASKKMPTHHLSEFRFIFEYSNVDEIYKDLVQGGFTKRYSGIVEYRPLSDDEYQKPLSL